MSSSDDLTNSIYPDASSQGLLVSRVDDLVGIGAWSVGQGDELTLDNNGPPMATGVDSKTNTRTDSEHKRLADLITFLGTPIAPQSVDWKRARQTLCQLRDGRVGREGDADIKAWNIVMTAHTSTLQYLHSLRSLLEELESKKTDVDRLSRIQALAQRFPEHAYHLVDISTPENLGDNT